MIAVTRVRAADREEVLALVERLLVELEDKPQEFAGLDRERILSDLAVTGGSPPFWRARRATPWGS